MASPTYSLISSLFVVLVLCVTSFSNEQDVDLKTIEAKSGIYECVNFYEQPSFSHPLLKNHTSKAIENLGELQAHKISGIGVRAKACPIGKVPILRAHPDTKIDDNPRPLFQNPQWHCVAIVHTNNLSWKLLGAGGGLTLYKPAVLDSQWSKARIKLLNEDESIEAGWRVDPKTYNDREAHLYVEFRPATATSGSKNLGFVQVSRVVPLGAIPKAYSVKGGRQVYWNISINKDQHDGNWWLLLGPSQTPVGYLPKEYFTSLANFANQVEWGGEVENPDYLIPHPEMGSGCFASIRYDIHESAAVVRATIIDEYHKTVTPGEDTHKVWDCEHLYTVKDADYKDNYTGRLFLYGGPNDFL